MICRAPTSDAKHLRKGDRVYVDFAGFIYDAAFVEERCRISSAEKTAAHSMGLRPGTITRERRFLLWRLGPEVEITGPVIALAQKAGG
jgi:hypothetical protein